MKVACLFTLVVSVLVCLLPVTPAQAQRDRVFVASYGSDSNPCTFGSPCKTFQQAVNVVAAGGEVTAIDSAGFGTIVITRAVTITSPNGVEAGIAAPAGGNAIVVEAQPSDVVSLNGLTLDGYGNASYGIQFNSGGALNVQNSVIRNFIGDGIAFFPAASSQLSVSNSLITNNSNDGIVVQLNSSSTVNAILDYVDLEQNENSGLEIYNNVDAGQIINLTVSDSVAASNGYGIYCAVVPQEPTSVMVRNSTLANNVNDGLATVSSGCQMWVTRSTIVGNGTGLLTNNGGTITSFSDNNVIGNGTDGTPTGTATYE